MDWRASGALTAVKDQGYWYVVVGVVIVVVVVVLMMIVIVVVVVLVLKISGSCWTFGSTEVSSSSSHKRTAMYSVNEEQRVTHPPLLLLLPDPGECHVFGDGSSPDPLRASLCFLCEEYQPLWGDG